MAESKQPKKRHVKAARDWLRKAEQSFEREDEARGDLDMMLARAELERAAEMQRGKRPRRVSAWAKECLAAGAALSLVAAGMLFWQPESVPASSLPAPPAPQMQRALEVPHEETAPVALPAVREAAPSEVQEAAEAMEKEEKKQVSVAAEERPAPKVALPDAQMRRLMREAGKSLRGQPPFGNE